MRVLIVEDEAPVCGFLCRAIEHLIPRASVHAVSNGLQGLEAFLASPIDLVISDNRMPHMSGIELLQAIRQRSAVPFIMISAEVALEQRALQAGASAYLGKPVGLGDLRVAIRGALSAHFGYTEPCAK